MTVPESARPLAGVRIVEISSFVAVPLAGMTLTQLGAEVIRIDPVGGAADYRRWPVTDDGESIYWAGLNRASDRSRWTCAHRKVRTWSPG